MCDGMDRQYWEGKSTGILHAYRCFAIDAIFSFCFASSMGALSDPDFRPPIEVAIELTLPMITWTKVPHHQAVHHGLPTFPCDATASAVSGAGRHARNAQGAGTYHVYIQAHPVFLGSAVVCCRLMWRYEVIIMESGCAPR